MILKNKKIWGIFTILLILFMTNLIVAEQYTSTNSIPKDQINGTVQNLTYTNISVVWIKPKVCDLLCLKRY